MPGEEQKAFSREALEANGWRQGSVLPAELHALIDVTPAMTTSDIAIVVSQDCDLLHDSLEQEPIAEILVARHATKNGNLWWGKNPRRIQFSLASDGSVVYEAVAHEHRRLGREVLVGAKADSTRVLGVSNTRLISKWLAKRYQREAFPDEFNRRLAAKRDEIRDSLKKHGTDLVELFLLVSDRELGADETYDLAVIATMKVEDFEQPDKRVVCQKAVDALAAAMNDCPGIEVTEHQLKSEAEVSLDEIRFLQRWDYDYLSDRG